MECIGSRVPYTKWRLHAFRHLLAASQPLSARTIKRNSSTLRHDQPNKASSDGTSTAPSQRLPQSPLIAESRRAREKNRKRRATFEDTALLNKNPWAVALASPIRLCAVTGARLPLDILGTWGLVKQADTRLQYMLPIGLMQDTLTKSKTPNAKAPNLGARDQEKSQDGTEEEEAEGSDEASADAFIPPAIRSKQPTRQLVLRMTELLPLIEAITNPLSKSRSSRSPILRLLPFRWRHPQGPLKRGDEPNLLWPKNMPDILLRSMRSDVYKKLDAVLGKYKRVGTPNGVWKPLDMPEYSDAALEEAVGKLEPFDRMAWGGIILLGPNSPTSVAGDAQAENDLDTVALPQTGSNVPVFNLSKLLSESDLQMLRGSHAQFQHKALFFRPEEKMGVTALFSLWKIKRLLSKIDLKGKE
ncbi:hypothetical protein N7541_005073 [Penicillium brevicompactum]|uniref:Uncharacterized protein n=1 Tax=Penicillium brevicompactum TaxID=5074 RepID=A0A9W9RE95_PENBR|nr:hypothetical protein N7541_005073 [Penicillium brevicompactum]